MTEKRFILSSRFSGSKKEMFLNGIVCAIPFVFEQAFFLSWFAYLPFAFLFLKQTNEPENNKIFTKSLAFGYGFYFVGYIWLTELYPLEYLGIEKSLALPLMVLVIFGVPAIHAVFWAVSAAFCRKLSEKAPYFLRLAVFPCVAVLAEYLQSLGTFAFPWCRVFVTQSAFPVLYQSASLFGSYFITYLVLLINGFLASAILFPNFKRRFMLAATALFCCNLAFGIIRMSLCEQAYTKNNSAFGAVVLQGNYPYDNKQNDPVSGMYTRYLFLCDAALEELQSRPGALLVQNTVVLLPETALPVTFYADRGYARLLAADAENRGITLAVGAFSSEENENGEDIYGNSVFVFTPDGKMSAPYSKQHLVPFGEYLPYRRFFEFALPALAASDAFGTDLSSGQNTAPIDTPVGKAGILICYESVFEELCRKEIKNGAEILFISTNDSTFGSSQALRHHLAQAQMRAVENNVPVLRAANTGISALIAPDGRLVQTLGADKTGYLAGILPYGTGHTLYCTLGDGILFLFAALLLCSYIYPRIFRKEL